MKKSLGILWMFCFLPSGAQEGSKDNVNSGFLSYNKHAYAVYEAWRGSGTLSFLFVSNKSEAFLAYQDDGDYKNFDLFLVKGNLRLRVSLGECVQEQLTIGGNFSDSRWHRVHLTRKQTNVTLTVDGCHSKELHCKWSSSANRWKALYVGGIPLNSKLNSLASPSIYYDTLQSGFQGCIGLLTHNTRGKGPRALLLRENSGTGTKCRMPCSSNHKRCTVSIDDVIHECECPGYRDEECWDDVKPSRGAQVSLSLVVSNSFDSIPKFSSKVTPISMFSKHVPMQAFLITKIIVQSTPVNARVTSEAANATNVRSDTANFTTRNLIRMTEQVESAPTRGSNWPTLSPRQLDPQSSLTQSIRLYSVPGHSNASTVTSWNLSSQVNITTQAKRNGAYLLKSCYSFSLLYLLCHAGL